MDQENKERFGGIGRLYGRDGLAKLSAANICIIGVGGVGAWSVEALARSGVGRLTLVDMDEVCVSNVNRQLHALDGEIGKPKVEVMAERLHRINPALQVECRQQFFTASTEEEILGAGYSAVLDAIDSVSNKALLIAACRKRKLAVVTVGGAGGRRDPTKIKTADLAFTSHDPLLQEIRRKLRGDFGFPREPRVPFGVPAVFSPENPVYPWSDGTVCEDREEGSDVRLRCEGGYGTATHVTGAFGFAAAGLVIEQILSKEGA